MEFEYRFCTSADGTRIAYASTGGGPPLVQVQGWPSNVELSMRRTTRFHYEAMAENRLYVTYDRRGCGSSQRDVDDISLDAQVADLEAVLASSEVQYLDLAASVDGCAVAIAFAARSPERVRRLVLLSPYPRGEDIAPPGAIEGTMSLIRQNWGLARRAIGDVVFPTGPTEEQIEFADYLRQTVSSKLAEQYVEFHGTVDVSDLLPLVQSPTLIAAFSADRNVPIAASRRAASMISGCRFLALDGYSSAFQFRGQEETTRALRAFLDEGLDLERSPERPAAAHPSGTAIILFLDIAGSTELTTRLGDAAYREKERDLDGALRQAISKAGGSPVEGKVLGDGVMAVFSSASNAIDAALACQALGDSAGLPLHAGIHAGDVIREENNVHGGAVQVAARIADASEPGEVLVSQTVRDLARTSAGVSFDDRGERELKGVSEPVRVFAVRPVGEAPLPS